MTEFTRQWNNFSAGTLENEVPQVTEGTNGTSGTQLQKVRVEKTIDLASSLTPGARSNQLLYRLQAGSRWLSEQHQKYLADDPTAVRDEQFSRALEGWDLMERELRQAGGSECIFGVGQKCPAEAPATCDRCITEPADATSGVQAAIGGVQGTLVSDGAELRDHRAEVLDLLRQRECHIGDGNPPPIDRPPHNEAELRRLIDYLSNPVAFARWFKALMNRSET